MSFHGDYLMVPSLSKHFAEDLLIRGAMDLQESLAMLERFQAASLSMRLLPSKKIRPETGEQSPAIDTIVREVLLRPSNAKQVQVNGLKQQLSDSTSELKNVVKDSFYKKNHSLVSNNEQASLTLSQSAWHLPNSYLMPKPAAHQKKSVPMSSPSCAAVRPEKSKTPSLVAKLMGLDGLPSPKAKSTMKDDKIKAASSPRALFDTERPRSKRLLPLLLKQEAGFGSEMPRSEKLPPLQSNVQKNSTSSKKGIVGTSYTTGAVHDTASIKPIQRAANVEQARPKSPKEIKIVSSPTGRKQRANEINRRSTEKQRPYSGERSRERMNAAKSRAGSASRSAEAVAKQCDRRSVASRSNRTCDSVVKPNSPKPQSNSKARRVPRRNVKSSTVDELVAYEIEKEILHALDQTDGPSTEHSATPSDEACPSADWDEASSVGDILKDPGEASETSQSAVRDCRISSAGADADAIHPSTHRAPTREAEIKDEIGLLLLSDKPFLSRAAELIGVGVYGDLSNQCDRISKAGTRNRRLYLDAAGEQLELKHRQQNILWPYARPLGRRWRSSSSAYLSLEELLRDVSDGVRNLEDGYCSGDARRGSKDSLDVKLERDLSSSADALISSVWDMGWQGLACVEEAECFVRDAGEEILSLLVEEAALDMCLHCHSAI